MKSTALAIVASLLFAVGCQPTTPNAAPNSGTGTEAAPAEQTVVEETVVEEVVHGLVEDPNLIKTKNLSNTSEYDSE